MTRHHRASFGFLAGLSATTWGAYLEWGRGIALIVGGTLLMVWFLLLYDVDEVEAEVQ